MQAVQAASESLRLVPEKIAQAEKLVQDKQGKVKSLETNKSTIVEAKEKKTAFIKNVDQLALVAKKEAEAKQDNSVLAQANAKFEETIALLKQDLSNTENQIASKQQELVAAENAVSEAKKGVETAMKLALKAPENSCRKRAGLGRSQEKARRKQGRFRHFQEKGGSTIRPDSNSAQKVLGRLAEINGLN